MTQKEEIREATMFAMRVKSIAPSIKSGGDDYNMQWHKGYCEQLNNACKAVLRDLVREGKYLPLLFSCK